MYRVLFTGSRDWGSRHDQAQITNDVLDTLRQAHGLSLLVIHGDAPGLDSLVDERCQQLGIDRVRFPANWKGRNLSAGPVRNVMMLDVGSPDEVRAFHPFISRSKGTKHCVEQARARGIPVVMYAGTTNSS
jgi:hypothetical protein